MHLCVVLIIDRCNQQFSETRVRSIEQMKYGNGSACDSTIDTETCPATTTDCVQTAWSSWSACTVLCGTGVQTRSRETIVPALLGGLACGDLVQYQNCTPPPCGPGLVCYPVMNGSSVTPTCIDLPASNPAHVCQAYRPCGFQQCFDIPAPNEGHYCFCDVSRGYVYGLASPWGGEGCADIDACLDNPCSVHSANCTDLPAPYYANNAAGRQCGPCNAGYSGDGSTCLGLFS